METDMEAEHYVRAQTVMMQTRQRQQTAEAAAVAEEGEAPLMYTARQTALNHGHACRGDHV